MNISSLIRKFEMWRTALLFLVLIPGTMLGYFIILFLGRKNPYSNKVNKLMRYWCKLNLITGGVKVEIEGEENVITDSSFILLANHQSAFDINVLGAYIPATVRFMAKKELFKYPFLGGAMKRGGIISVDRQNRAKAVNSIKETIKLLHNNKVGVIGFPEGTRTPDGEVKHFKSGLFIMALESQLPITPVSISGAYDICNKHSLHITPGTIKVIIHPAVDVTEYSHEDKNDLVKKVKEIIEAGVYAKTEVK